MPRGSAPCANTGTWAEELWDKTDTETRKGMDYDAFIADAIETMHDEFSNALEEVCDE